MKKIAYSILLLTAFLFAVESYAATNLHHEFEREVYRRGFNARFYNKGYYYHPHFVYESAPQVAYSECQYGPRRLGYYFYPGVNVYFNPVNHLYIYPSRGVWVTGNVLPRGFIINEPFRQVYCEVGENIWAYNRVHINTYRRAPIYVERGRGAEHFRERVVFRERR